MDNHEINHLDPDDIGLKQIMGNRFHDATQGTTSPMVEKKPTKATSTTTAEKVPQKAMDKAVDAQWEPVRPEPNWLDKLKGCAMWAVGFGFLTVLFFSWQQAGLMDPTVAVPTMLTCTALGGWGVGKNATRGNR